MTGLSDDLPGFLMFLRQPSTTSTTLSASAVSPDWNLGYDAKSTPGSSAEGTRIEVDVVAPSSAGALSVLLAFDSGWECAKILHSHTARCIPAFFSVARNRVSHKK